MEDFILSLINMDELATKIADRLILDLEAKEKHKSDKKDYWKVPEAMAYYNVSERTIRRWQKNGKLPKHKINGVVLIPIKEAQSLVKKKIND